MADSCKHMNFNATVTVNRLEDSGRFMAEVRIHCTECNLPFQFMGLEPGVDLGGARVSLDGLEANLAICPQGKAPSPMDRIILNVGRVGKTHG